MGSMINYCIQEKANCIKIREILLIEDNNNNNKQNKNIQNYDLMLKIITKYIMLYYFKKLKNYHKTIGNEDKENEELNIKEENKKNDEQNKKDILKKNIKTSQNGKELISEIPIVEEKNENKNDEKKNKNNDSTLNKSENAKSGNDNKDNTNMNMNETNKDLPSYEKKKLHETPKGEPNSTPTGNYDKSLIPGDLIFNFNDIPLNDEIAKVENDLGEFIIDQKELLKYMEQYPYVPKSFSIKYPSGEKYSGYFSPNWEKEVFGIQINPNGSKYVGLFKNGMYDGRGRLIFRKGDYYEGEFKDNKANGFGKYVNIKGDIYIGNWVNDQQEGKGELILKNGSMYTGYFKNGMENGKGKIIWPDSSFYEGDFVNNSFDGYGIYMMRNKKNYIGQWKKGQMNGFGIFNYPDGKSFKGYFEKDKKNGFGIYSGKNNLRFEGNYKKGKQYGIGRVINEKGELQLGLYLKGKRLKILNDKDFQDDILKLDKEIENINNIINTNEFFVKNVEYITVTQGQYFGNTPE